MTRTVTTIDRDLIEEALDSAGFDSDECALGDTYSGRGMHGTTCLSITFPNNQGLALFMFELGQLTDDLAEGANSPVCDEMYRSLTAMVHAVRVDNMGTGVVAYFPGFIFGGAK